MENQRTKILPVLLTLLALVFALLACTGTHNTDGGNDVTGIPNPMVSYAGLADLNGVVGSRLEKPAEESVADEAFYVIGGDVADYRFTADGVSYTYRAAKTADDISGIWTENGTVFAEEPLSASPSAYEGEGFVTMRWLSDGVQYVLTAQADGVTYEQVADRMMAFAALTIPNGETYRLLEGNYREASDDRTVMYVGNLGDAVIVFVNRSDEGYESTNWRMTCRLDGSRLVYEDCRRTEGAPDEAGVYIETVAYENGVGWFDLTAAGNGGEGGRTLCWSGAREEECSEMVFEPMTE